MAEACQVARSAEALDRRWRSGDAALVALECASRAAEVPHDAIAMAAHVVRERARPLHALACDRLRPGRFALRRLHPATDRTRRTARSSAVVRFQGIQAVVEIVDRRVVRGETLVDRDAELREL